MAVLAGQTGIRSVHCLDKVSLISRQRFFQQADQYLQRVFAGTVLPGGFTGCLPFGGWDLHAASQVVSLLDVPFLAVNKKQLYSIKAQHYSTFSDFPDTSRRVHLSLDDHVFLA